MSADLPTPPPASSAATPTALFAPGAPQPPARSALPWIVAAAVVLLAGALLLLTGRRHVAPAANGPRPLDPYAAHVGFSDIQMSESTSLSGGKSTFIDGQVKNTGSSTLTAATVQVIFANDEALPPQVETVPLTLIRTRDPYIDTEPLSAAPLAPGDSREFRLIFENIGANWNQQLPEVHLVAARLK